jgi:hypothetical protein
MSTLGRCCFLLSLVAAAGASGETRAPGASGYAQRQGPAALTVPEAEIEAGKVTVRLSGALALTLSVEGPAALQVEPVRSLTTSPGWTSVAGPAETATLGPNRVRWQQTFRLTPYKPGDNPIQPAPLRYREAADDDRWQTVEWQPVPVTVTTEVLRAELKELRDIAPPEAVPPAEPLPLWLPATLVGLAGVLLFLAGREWARRRPRRKFAESPQVWALGELDRLDALALPAAGAVERYHTLLSDVIRRYLELRFQLHAPRQTTAEFLEALRRSSVLPPPHQELLRDFLQRCDLAKFARAALSPEECQETGRLARALVEQTALMTVPAEPGEEKPGTAPTAAGTMT